MAGKEAPTLTPIKYRQAIPVDRLLDNAIAFSAGLTMIDQCSRRRSSKDRIGDPISIVPTEMCGDGGATKLLGG